jgi:hypothetical protein
MRRFGYLVEQGPQGVVRECDTATCGHCQFVMQLPPAPEGRVIVRIAAPCGMCRRFVCDQCKAKGGCEPWEKRMERMERRERLRDFAARG